MKARITTALSFVAAGLLGLALVPLFVREPIKPGTSLTSVGLTTAEIGVGEDGRVRVHTEAEIRHNVATSDVYFWRLEVFGDPDDLRRADRTKLKTVIDRRDFEKAEGISGVGKLKKVFAEKLDLPPGPYLVVVTLYKTYPDFEPISLTPDNEISYRSVNTAQSITIPTPRPSGP